MKITNSPVVSVIMPLFNCEQYVGEAIESVISQTFEDWKMIVVDDCSADKSREIVERYLNDRRIELIQHASNRGSAEARRTAIAATPDSEYLAYMDADDVWMPNKLESQLHFMKETGSVMCFTSYETIEADGDHRNYVHVPKDITYHQFLKNTITCSHTMILDLKTISKDELISGRSRVDYEYPEDMDTWCSILKQGIVAQGLDVILAKNRKHSKSRSANKFRAVRRTWNQYRKNEKLSILYSLYCLFWQLFHAIQKRV